MLFRNLANLYSFSFPTTLVKVLRQRHYAGSRLITWFWQTKSFRTTENQLSFHEETLAGVLAIAMAAQIVWGIWLLIDWARFGTAGTWQFGLAIMVSYPLVWVHLLAVGVWVYKLAYYAVHPKKAGRAVVCTILEYQVKRLRKRYQFTVVAVAGSVGKTSTKLAIADLLSQSLRVRHQTGNYNDRVTVPLVFFGQPEPSLFNVVAWLKLVGANQAALSHPYPYDVVVVELGTDAPGQMADFAYLRPDIAVVTAVTPEHMEYFKTLDGVATEELTVFDYSERVLVNGDDIPGKYLAGRAFTEYSLKTTQADYFALTTAHDLHSQHLDIVTPTEKLKTDVQYIGAQGAKFALAATAVADMMGVKSSAISNGLPKLSHFAGRMQILTGIKNSILIDDTYNASPVAVQAALDVLYEAKAPQRIAILGSMNEMGDYSPEAHREVGEYCDPEKFDLLVIIGVDAKKYLAPVAKEKGCTVKTFLSPYEAGEYVKSKLKTGAVVLAKGSQNGVFAEEALKPLLADPADISKLVRQSPEWLKKKQAQFNGFPEAA
jgi:UDP-N-acetylmuramoyl-tripeptide--D-alanyl-D-alanine ligase